MHCCLPNWVKHHTWRLGWRYLIITIYSHCQLVRIALILETMVSILINKQLLAMPRDRSIFALRVWNWFIYLRELWVHHLLLATLRWDHETMRGVHRTSIKRSTLIKSCVMDILTWNWDTWKFWVQNWQKFWGKRLSRVMFWILLNIEQFG